MVNYRRVVLGLVVGCGLPWLLGGCSTAQKTAPHMGVGDLEVQAQIKRDDLVVLDAVEGTSTTTIVAFGLVNVIDGDKYQICGIKFFEDKFTYWKDDQWWPEPENRAYYKALEKQSDADAVMIKSFDRTQGGVPMLWETHSATVRGKAMKLKADTK